MFSFSGNINYTFYLFLEWSCSIYHWFWSLVVFYKSNHKVRVYEQFISGQILSVYLLTQQNTWMDTFSFILGVSDYAALDTFIRDALSGLAKSGTCFILLSFSRFLYILLKIVSNNVTNFKMAFQHHLYC